MYKLHSLTVLGIGLDTDRKMSSLPNHLEIKTVILVIRYQTKPNQTLGLKIKSKWNSKILYLALYRKKIHILYSKNQTKQEGKQIKDSTKKLD